MSYATLVDMVARFGEAELLDLSDRDNSGQLNEAAIIQALADASAVMDGYIAGRYALPLQRVPAALVPLCCDMARYQLYDDRAPEALAKRNDAALSFLKAVGKGELSLGLDSSGAPAPTNNVATLSSDGHVFSRRNAGGFI